MLKTVRRDTLRKAARNGKLYVKCKFHYTDDYAFDNANSFGKMDGFAPAYYVDKGDSPQNAPRGTIPLPYFYFSGSGRAYIDERGKTTLVIHSNLCYEVEIRR